MALGIVVTDLDGTLLDSSRRLGAADRRTLEELGERGITRVVATGRSLYSALLALPADAPIDYLCHSSGAGVLRWADRQSIRAINMPHTQAAALALVLIERELDFMLHHAIPDSHFFYAHRAGRNNADFERRAQRYAAFGSVLALPLARAHDMSQAIVIEPVLGSGLHDELTSALPDFQVIRTTSPLDGTSTWIEIFPRGVSKAAAATWLWPSRVGSHARLAVGNDYNDLDLLEWGDLACVVGNAPADLRARYVNVGTNDEAGFSQAVRLALERL